MEERAESFSLTLWPYNELTGKREPAQQRAGSQSSLFAVDKSADFLYSKGKSEDSPCSVTLMMDHINSYKKKKLNNRTPYEAFSFCYGEEPLKPLGGAPVAPEDIILTPPLLKKQLLNLNVTAARESIKTSDRGVESPVTKKLSGVRRLFAIQRFKL